MTEKDKEIQELRAELDWLMQSEAVRSMAQKDEKGNHKYDIRGLDRCIKELHKRALEAEKKAQTAQAEATLYRRQVEALVDPPAETAKAWEYHEPHPSDADLDDERRFPVFA